MSINRMSDNRVSTELDISFDVINEVVIIIAERKILEILDIYKN